MFGGYGPLFLELFPIVIISTAMSSAFNLAIGIQFFTPVIIAVIAETYGLAGGISLADLFALLTGAWIWTFQGNKREKIRRSGVVLKFQYTRIGNMTTGVPCW